MKNHFAFDEFKSTWVRQSNTKIRDGSIFQLSSTDFTVNQMTPSYKNVNALMKILSTNTVVYCCILEVQQNIMIQLNNRYYKLVILKVQSVDPWESVMSNLLGSPKGSFSFFPIK